MEYYRENPGCCLNMTFLIFQAYWGWNGRPSRQAKKEISFETLQETVCGMARSYYVKALTNCVVVERTVENVYTWSERSFVL